MIKNIYFIETLLVVACLRRIEALALFSQFAAREPKGDVRKLDNPWPVGARVADHS
jgi:hypothetical protein